MSDMKPCPFCGNDGTGPIEGALHVCLCEYDDRGAMWAVQCDKCTATMGYSESEEEAIADWNRRVITPAEAARVLLAYWWPVDPVHGQCTRSDITEALEDADVAGNPPDAGVRLALERLVIAGDAT